MNDLVPGSKLSVRLLWPFARLLGGDLELFARLGLSSAEFANPDTRIPHRVVVRALSLVIDQTADPALGLRAGLCLDAADLGCLEQAARSAPTLCDAARIMAENSRVLTDAAKATILTEGETGVWRIAVSGMALCIPALNDFAIGAAVAFLRRNLAVYERPVEIRLTHARPPYAEEYRRLLGVEPSFGASCTAVAVRRSLLSVPLLRANRNVSMAFELQVRRRIAEIESKEGAAELVRGVVTHQFQDGSVSMRHTAQKLAMSVATLRRRLEDEGTTFSVVVDGLRKQMAARYLSDSDVTVSEVAFMLGFAGVASFGRAFKRWSGVTPSEFRTAAVATTGAWRAPDASRSAAPVQLGM